MSNQIYLLKSKKFLPLFITQFFGAFNDNMFKNAFLIWFTYDISSKLNIDAQLIITLASGLFILPFFLFSFLAGQIADKFERSRIIHIIKIAEIIIMVFAFIGFYFENVSLLLMLIFAMGIHSTFFSPIKYGLLPEILKDNELIAGNALIEGGTFLAILLGTIIGGVVIRSENGVAIISSAVFLLAIIGYVTSLFIIKNPIADSKLKISFNMLLQTKKIISYAKKKPNVWLTIIGISWFWFIGITFISQFPIYTKEILKGNEVIVSFFLAIFSIGIAIGSIMCNKLLKGKIDAKLVPFGLCGITLGILLLCLSSFFYQAPLEIITLQQFLTTSYYNYSILFSLLIISLAAGIYIVPLYAIMQHQSESKFLSRIIAANNVVNAFFMVVSSVVIVVLIKLSLTLLQIFLIIALINIFIFLLIRKIISKNLVDKT